MFGTGYATDVISLFFTVTSIDFCSIQASDVLSRFTMSQIVWLAFGGTMDIDWLHERQLEIGHGWTKYAALHTFFGDLVQYVPFTPAWRIVQLRRETEGAIYNVIKQLRQEGNPENEAHGHAQNLIATMLKAKNPKTGKLVTDREIVEEACTMLFAGYDTTSTTMSWALYYVSKDPETLRWVQEELDSVLGFGASARDVTMEDLPNLKRTRAFINETLRLRPPLLTASRFTTHATKLGKYDIPAETIVNANIFLVHRNPKYWDDPHTFNPRRWDSNASDDADAASTEKHDEKRRHPFAFVPFAAGARNCIGKNFALQEMIIAMALVLSKFNVEYDPTKPFSVFGSPVPTPDVYLKFHPRK
jgi:cytochrome P450